MIPPPTIFKPELYPEICEVCATPYMTATPKPNRIGLCATHRELHQKGYLALVEAESLSGNVGYTDHYDALRNGKIAHVTYSVATQLFGTQFSSQDVMMYVVVGTMDIIQNMITKPEKDWVEDAIIVEEVVLD